MPVQTNMSASTDSNSEFPLLYKKHIEADPIALCQKMWSDQGQNIRKGGRQIPFHYKSNLCLQTTDKMQFLFINWRPYTGSVFRMAASKVHRWLEDYKGYMKAQALANILRQCG